MTRFSTVNIDTFSMVETLNKKNDKSHKKGTKLAQLLSAFQRNTLHNM